MSPLPPTLGPPSDRHANNPGQKNTQQTEKSKLLLLFCLFEAESRPSATVAAAAAAAEGKPIRTRPDRQTDRKRDLANLAKLADLANSADLASAGSGSS